MTRPGALLIAAVILSSCSPEESAMVVPAVASVSLSRDSATMLVGSELQLYARARTAAGVLLERRITWWSSDPRRADIPDSDGRVVAYSPGAVHIFAYAESRADTALIIVQDTIRTVLPDPPEARALWVAAGEWQTAADIGRVMTLAKSANFNVVFFQARSNGSALYPSALEPCAVELCGQLGQTAPWDPLKLAVEQAHARGIQLHAWVSALRVWPSSATACTQLRASAPGNPGHVLLAHPEWRMIDSLGAPHACPNSEDGVYVTPGAAAARTHVARVVAEIVRGYNVDGVHLDDLRYPGTGWSYDSASVARFRATYGFEPDYSRSSWDFYRRALVGDLVREAFDSALAIYPGLFRSVGVSALYEDRWNWGSEAGYTDRLEDPYAWSVTNLIDAVVPRSFLRLAPERCQYGDWECVMEDHLLRVQWYTNRHLVMGILATVPAIEITDQIVLARNQGVRGFAVHSFAQADAHGLFAALAAGPFNRPAEVPPLVGR